MKAASIQEIKQELQGLSPSKLAQLCLRLAKFKKENKEILTYLLFEADDETAYIANVKKEMDEGFADLPKPNVYLTKKSLRKVLRMTLRQIKYSDSTQTEIELLTYFLRKVLDTKIPLQNSPVLMNLYRQQLKKVHAALATLHEDLQYDYRRDLEGLEK
ncbi:MAG TPA: hypothetical protein VNU72_03875 [Puia sp.]|jgi:hypothetical protein|nr:hypothetical protein [Puia sp.]